MRLIEQARNILETNSAFASLFNGLGQLPIYRAVIMRRIHDRIAFVEKHRCHSLMIEVSSKCNARCTFCPHSKMVREKRLMDRELFDLIVRRLRDEGFAPPLIDLFVVGEPLLDPSLSSKIRRLKATFPSSAVRITTNFAIVHDGRIEELLASGLDSIHISLNAATDATYQHLMGLSYDRTLRNIETLLSRREAVKSRLNVMLSFVVCKDNSAEVKTFVRMWRKRVDSICIQRAIDWGGHIEIDQPYPLRMCLYPCNDLFERIVILSNGEVALCCQDHEGVVGENVRNTPIWDAFHSRAFNVFREEHLNGNPGSPRLCRNCFAIHSNGANWLFKKHK